MSAYLGIDTSNYTTSTAIIKNNTVLQCKKLLPVKQGELGLKQSDAVFHHIQRLPDLLEELLIGNNQPLTAVGVSVRPRDTEGSYMPCFSAGHSTARSICAALNIPLYTFSHQAGHIISALYSAERLDLIKKPFIAFHLSGGTTEAVLVTPSKEYVFKTEIIAKSLDLKAGQAVDRVGQMLGLPFPSGAELEKLADLCADTVKPVPTLKGFDCCISGIENQCKKLLENGEAHEKIAKYCIYFILNTLDKMTERITDKYGSLPLVYAGGVMSNKTIRNHIQKKYDAFFAEPIFSCDNSAGIAILTKLKDTGEL